MRKYIKNFNLFDIVNESASFNELFDWIKSEYSQYNVTKISENDNELSIHIDSSKPITDRGYYDKLYVDIKITISDYSKDYDYSVNINGKYGEYGYETDFKSKERWINSTNISTTKSELTLQDVKDLISNELDIF